MPSMYLLVEEDFCMLYYHQLPLPGFEDLPAAPPADIKPVIPESRQSSDPQEHGWTQLPLPGFELSNPDANRGDDPPPDALTVHEFVMKSPLETATPALVGT